MKKEHNECTHTRIFRFSFQLTQSIKATIDARKTIIHLKKKYNSIELTIVRDVWLWNRADR